jgi:hypothetical protein
LESTLSLAHAVTLDIPDAKLYKKTESRDGEFLQNFDVFEAKLMHLLASNFLLNNPHYTRLCELKQAKTYNSM